MQQRQRARQRLQVQRPVEGGVAAAHYQHVMIAEIFHPPHGVVDRGALVLLDAGHRRPFRLEGAAAGGDHHDLAEERRAGIGTHAEAPVRLARQAFDHLPEVEGRLERRGLLQQLLDQPLAGDDRIAGMSLDRLLGIELGALPAGLVEDVDQRALDVEEAKLETANRPIGPAPTMITSVSTRPPASVRAIAFHFTSFSRTPGGECGGQLSAGRPDSKQDCCSLAGSLGQIRPALQLTLPLGTVTTRPSSSSRTRIWQDSREVGRTSKAKSSSPPPSARAGRRCP